MSPARSILGVFRHWLLRETGLYLGLLAVAMQLGLAVAHVAPARAEAGIGLPWCSGATNHEPLAPETAHAGAVCPLCQLPPLGPDPTIDAGLVAPIAWHVDVVFDPDDAPARSGARIFQPIQPRAPPVSA
jgi:hypothetical protein